MNQFNQTSEFSTWLKSLKDRVAIANILSRIRSAEAGNFGDTKPVGDGVHEMRIDFGPGYRVYYTRIGQVIYLLLLGGSKSTQKSDIRKAIALADSLKKD
jgi:putative addiction module killer protein